MVAMAAGKGRTLDTFPCPKCGKTLMAGVRSCQFCGAQTDVKASSGSTQAAVRRYKSGLTFQEICVYLVAVLWIAGGAYDLAQAIGWAPMLIEHFGGKAYFGMLAGFRLGLGLAILFQLDLATIVARFLALIQIAFSGVTVVLALLGGAQFSLGMGVEVLQIALAAFVFYLMGVAGE